MAHLNVEIKAKCSNPGMVRDYLNNHKAHFKGVDEQTDTYFNVNDGRLKLREGNIENNLIYYRREDQPGPKNSTFYLIKIEDPNGLKEILGKTNGIKMIVKKKREIYYINNVKFHIDDVADLGKFIEIEAGNLLADKTENELLEQCNYYLKEFGINENDLVAESYSDLMMKKNPLT